MRKALERRAVAALAGSAGFRTAAAYACLLLTPCSTELSGLSNGLSFDTRAVNLAAGALALGPCLAGPV